MNARDNPFVSHFSPLFRMWPTPSGVLQADSSLPRMYSELKSTRSYSSINIFSHSLITLGSASLIVLLYGLQPENASVNMVPRAKMLNILTNLLLLIAYILVSTGFNELDDKCSVCVY